jgi:hypothetical protein
MKTYVHLWQYLAKFFLEWEMFQTKVVDKIKTHILCSITFSRKSYRLWDNVEKYGTARQATDDNIIRRMRFACWTYNDISYCNTKSCLLCCDTVTSGYWITTFRRIFVLLKRRELIAHRHGVTSQKSWIFSNTAVTTAGHEFCNICHCCPIFHCNVIVMNESVDSRLLCPPLVQSNKHICIHGYCKQWQMCQTRRSPDVSTCYITPPLIQLFK